MLNFSSNMLSSNFIGRKKELERLINICDNKSSSAVLIGVKGKRRVGKTFFVNKFSLDYSKLNDVYYVNFIGSQQSSSRENLNNCKILFIKYFENFYIQEIKNKSIEMEQNFLSDFTKKIKKTTEWLEFFLLLNDFCYVLKTFNKKLILFLDEICWFSKKNNFVSQFKTAWNTHLVLNDNLICLLAGSVISWMDTHLFLNTKEFYNRIDATIEIEPFSLKEIGIYLKSKNSTITEEDIIRYYYIFGGIIKYYSEIDFNKSYKENFLDFIKNKRDFFEKEKEILFDSLFSKNRLHQQIVYLLCSKKSANVNELIKTISRKQIANNSIYIDLEELEKNKIIYADDVIKGKSYSLNDNFVYFFYYWFVLGKFKNFDFNNSDYDNWKGSAFEILVLNQIDKILEKETNKILNLTTIDLGNGKKQIDLVLNYDDVFNYIVEVKNYKNFWSLTENEENNIISKVYAFNKPVTKPLLITLNGSKSNNKNIQHICLVDWLNKSLNN